jgi:hypothetical protein
LEAGDPVIKREYRVTKNAKIEGLTPVNTDDGVMPCDPTPLGVL